MKLLTETQRHLIIDFIDGDILPEEITAALGTVPLDTPNLILMLLQSAVASENSQEAAGAFGLIRSFRNTLDKSAVPLLITLLQRNDHYWHEEIVSTLQGIKEDSRAVDALFKTALSMYDYLGYDDSSALARKCTWALADIGNENAYQKLQLLSTNSNAHIARYAQKRVDSWSKEQGRKAFHFAP